MLSLPANLIKMVTLFFIRPFVKYQMFCYRKYQNINYLLFFRTLFDKAPQPSRSAIITKFKIKHIFATQTKQNEQTDSRTIFFIHGGGYIAGSTKSHAGLGYRLATAANATVIIIEYRLAPENPFPAALEDCIMAYEWLLESGVNPKHLVMAGDSAGGGLALATLIALRDKKTPLPDLAVCISPWVDLALTSLTNYKNLPMQLVAKQYLDSADPFNPLISPLYADLTNLPSLYLLTSDAEFLYDDAVRFATKAKQAKVEVILDVWHGMPHDWPILAKILPEGQAAIDKMGAYIQERVKVD